MAQISLSPEHQLIADFNLFNGVMPNTCGEFLLAHLSSSEFVKAANPINGSMAPHVKSFYLEHVLPFGLGDGYQDAGWFKNMLHRKNIRFAGSANSKKNRARAMRFAELSRGSISLDSPLTYLDASFIEWSHEALARIVINMKKFDANLSILDALKRIYENPEDVNYFMFDFGLVRLLIAGLEGRNPVGSTLLDLFELRRSSPGDVHRKAYVDFIESQVGKAIARDYDAKKTAHLDAPVKAVDMDKTFTVRDDRYFVRTPKDKSKKPSNHFVKNDNVNTLNLYTKQEKRLDKGFDMNMIGRCPTPLKKVHVTMEKALEFIAEHHAGDSQIKPYTCGCGALHLGHLVSRDNSRDNRKARRAKVAAAKLMAESVENVPMEVNS